LEHVWPEPQHTVLLQHFWVEVHEVLPQQDCPVGAQNAVDPVVQHFWVELQEVFPQQVVPPLAQNGLDPVVQHV